MADLSYHRTGLKLLKFAHKVEPGLIALCIAEEVVRVAGTYLGLVFTSGLVDALVDADAPSAAAYAAAIALTAFVSSAVVKALDCRTDEGQRLCARKIPLLVRAHVLSLDYEAAESAELRERIASLEETMRCAGSLGYLVGAYQQLFRAALSMLTCVAFVAVLCVAPPDAGTEGLLAAVCSPAGSAVVLGLAFAFVVWRSDALSRRTASAYADFGGASTGVELRAEWFTDNFFVGLRFPKLMRLYNMYDMVSRRYYADRAEMLRFYNGWLASVRKASVLSELVNLVFVSASYVLVAAKVLAGAVTVGSFATYAGALAQFGGAYTEARTQLNEVRRMCAYLGQVLEILETPGAHAKGSRHLGDLAPENVAIAFEHVGFTYPGSSEPVLKDVCCMLEPGCKLAVVGPNGAGKTTFIKLLCRLYEPTEGRITLNGVDICEFDEDEYRKLFSVVFQDFRLFAAPVWENVCAGAPRDDEKLSRVLAESGAAAFVDGLEDGANTLLYRDLGEGVAPSGGEEQKLALARALYKDAPVVILDEPTAALDPLAEAEVYEGFDAMVAGKTAIYISHRMSSCRFCDRILVFDSGRIVEQGTHDELLAQDGLYARLWRSQAQYYA